MMDKFQNVGFNKVLNEVRYRKIRPYFTGKTCFEVGCGEGQLTKHLVKDFDRVMVADKKWSFLDGIPSGVTKIRWDIEKRPWTYANVDTVICSNVLEHLKNPKKALKNIRRLGDKESVFIFVTPNGRSFHRLTGAILGFLKFPMDLDPVEKKYGHKRVFSFESLTNLLKEAGFTISRHGTYFYKPYPNKIMETLPKRIIKNCENTATAFSGAEILVVCKL